MNNHEEVPGYTKQVGTRLQLLRNPISQADFASKIGVNKNLLGKYERGETAPGSGFLIKVHEATGVNLHWLLTGGGPMRVTDATPTTPQAAHEYPPFIKPVVMTRIIGVLLSNETDGRYPPLKEVAERICKYYLEDCWDYINGTRPIPPEASTEAIESLRTRKPIS